MKVSNCSLFDTIHIPIEIHLIFEQHTQSDATSVPNKNEKEVDQLGRSLVLLAACLLTHRFMFAIQDYLQLRRHANENSM